MALRIFSLNGVPDDEVEEVRALLAEHRIDYYETPAGNWGISTPALWLRDDDQREAARRLLDDYQAERAVRMREEYAQQLNAGTNRTLRDVIRDNPLRFIVYLAAIFAVAYFSTIPFFDMGK
ncbi:MAG: hypothetical protein KGZ83_16555 [Sulfuricella sp.]|nr:hypothetical protein [Sulfuricella sp.]